MEYMLTSDIFAGVSPGFPLSIKMDEVMLLTGEGVEVKIDMVMLRRSLRMSCSSKRRSR